MSEQQRIAAILDQADALQHMRRRVLSGLEELGKTIFRQMFGDVSHPRRFDLFKPLGSICTISSGSTPSRQKPEYYGGPHPWVKTTEVKGGVIHSTEEHVTEEGRQAGRLKIYPKGTVLVAMYGQGKTRGKVGILGVTATINQACAAIQCAEECRPDFLHFQLGLCYDRLRAMGQGGNQPNLNAQLIRDFKILVPSLDEQDNFLERLHALQSAQVVGEKELSLQKSLFTSLQHRAFNGEL